MQEARRQRKEGASIKIMLCNTLYLLFYRNMDIVTFVEKISGATSYIKGATFLKFEQLLNNFLKFEQILGNILRDF